jgi:hypothetical protein
MSVTTSGVFVLFLDRINAVTGGLLTRLSRKM